jgi:hypothetical protein
MFLAVCAVLLLLGQLGTPLIAGQANYADPSHGSSYLAMRLPRGTHVRITGAGGSVLMTVNDYGPVEATGDIADIALVRFAKVCGYTIPEAKRRGECAVEVEVLTRVPTVLPATDTE